MMSKVRVASSALLVIAAALAGGWLIQRAVSNGERSTRDGAQLLESVMQRVRQSYIEEVDEERVWELAMLGMIDELGDPNTAYLTPERLERLTQTASNSYVGVGIQMDVRDGWVTVALSRPGSPAERAGLQPGDRLVEIDGRSMKGWTAGEAGRELQGPPGTSVSLMIERSASTRIQVALERAQIIISAVARATVLDGGVGYLAVTTFSDSTEVEVERAVDSLRAAGARSVILDLRGNPGGLLAQGVGVADLFLSAGQRIVSTKGRVTPSNTVYMDSTADRWADLPVVVLVSRGTASAAEIVAGALQDHDRALVMGQPTYGKGSAQAIYPLDNGAALSLTNAHWFTPLGRSIEYARPGEIRLADADTSRPRFKTALGRAVYGGGGIVPDIAAGDSALDPAERRFYSELGRDVPAWRQLGRELAATLVRGGAVGDSLFTVTPQWRERFYSMMMTRGLLVSTHTYAEVQDLTDRLLGNEAARLAFGQAYATRRLVRNDVVVQRAADILKRSRSARDVFGE